MLDNFIIKVKSRIHYVLPQVLAAALQVAAKMVNLLRSAAQNHILPDLPKRNLFGHADLVLEQVHAIVLQLVLGGRESFQPTWR
jgi:hypothetical protein